MAQSDFDRSMRIIKYILLCITTILVLFSAVIITYGTTVYTNYRYISFFLYENFLFQALATSVIGIIILVVSLYGWIGALRESICLINSFAVILSFTLVLELYAAAVAFNMRDMVYWILEHNVPLFFKQYNDEFFVRRAFDQLQSELKCCGVESSWDWENANRTVPRSCCEDYLCQKVYTQGCLPVLHGVPTRLCVRSGCLDCGFCTDHRYSGVLVSSGQIDPQSAQRSLCDKRSAERIQPPPITRKKYSRFLP